MGGVWAQTIGQKWSKKSARAYPVVTLGSAALQGRIAVESGDSAPIAGCSGPVPMVWAPRTARGALIRAVHRRRRAPVEDAPLGRLHQYLQMNLRHWRSICKAQRLCRSLMPSTLLRHSRGRVSGFRWCWNLQVCNAKFEPTFRFAGAPAGRTLLPVRRSSVATPLFAAPLFAVSSPRCR